MSDLRTAQGDINTRTNWLEQAGRDGNANTYNSELKKMDDVLAKHKALLATADGKKLLDQVEASKAKAKKMLDDKIAELAVKDVERKINSKKSFKDVKAVEQLLATNEAVFSGSEAGKKLKADTEAWIGTQTGATAGATAKPAATSAATPAAAAPAKADIRDVRGSVNRMENWLVHSAKSTVEYSGAAKLQSYITEAEEFYAKNEAAGVWDTDADFKKEGEKMKNAIVKGKANYEEFKHLDNQDELAAMENLAINWSSEVKNVQVKNSDTVKYTLTLEFKGMSRKDTIVPNRTISFANPGETVTVVELKKSIVVPDNAKCIVIKNKAVTIEN